MSNISTIIVEDEPIIAADLENQLKKLGFEVYAIFEDGNDVIDYLKNSMHPDVLLMDIQLEGELDGIETAMIVNKKFQLPIIFITSNTDSTSFRRAKLTHPSAFLSKPFRIKDITNAIELALESPIATPSHDIEFMADRVFIKSKDSLDRVMYDSILYVEAEGAYTKIVTKERDFIICQTLGKTEERLWVSHISKVHRSFLVNLKQVTQITDGYLIGSNFKVPMSKTYKEDILKLFKRI
ncbi:MAG: response regulator [Saprospiraceae bacterium]